MPNSVYYDTCLFLHAQNSSHPQSKHCGRILPPSNVTWTVCLSSEISLSEAAIKEFLDTCYVHWVSNGTQVKDVTVAEAKIPARTRQAQKKALRQLGFEGSDFKHLMAAVHAKAEVLCSCDADFFDPKTKAGHHGTTVKDYIESEFQPLKICRPSAL